MTVDKYPCIFSRQMKAIVYTITDGKNFSDQVVYILRCTFSGKMQASQNFCTLLSSGFYGNN